MFNYPFLINQLSENGFAHCKSLLFPMLDYQYMTVADVRKIELCEKVYDLVNRFPAKAGQDKPTSCEAYIHAIEYQMQNVLKCKSGSIAAEYKSRALQMIAELQTEKEIDEETVYEKLLTLFSIYLGLLRSTAPDFTETIAEDARLNADRDDTEILKKFREIKAKKDIKTLFRKHENQQSLGNDIVYIHSVILLCLLLEILGEYERRDDNGQVD